MNLDFSKCKTVADVNKVWKEHQKEAKILKDFEKRLKEDKIDELEGTENKT